MPMVANARGGGCCLSRNRSEKKGSGHMAACAGAKKSTRLFREAGFAGFFAGVEVAVCRLVKSLNTDA